MNKIAVQQNNSLIKLAVSIFLCEMVGIVSSLLSRPINSAWFNNLYKPSWNPPSYLFAPVWVLLYWLMGISIWIIWKSDVLKTIKANAIGIFILQLVFNFLWSILFFKFNEPYYAFIDIVILLITISLTIYYFSLISKKASWLLVPYLMWVCFATILNYSIWKLNP